MLTPPSPCVAHAAPMYQTTRGPSHTLALHMYVSQPRVAHSSGVRSEGEDRHRRWGA